MSQGVLADSERLLNQGDLAGARALLEARLEADPHDYEALCAAGVTAYLQGETHHAKSRLLRAVKDKPRRPEAYRHLADLLAAEGEPRRAEAFYQLAHQAEPRDAEALIGLAEMYQDCGLPYAAKRTLRAVLAIADWHQGARACLTALEQTFPDRAVTVYLPCYNAAHTLPRVIEALLAQTYPITELLVIDDGSTDGSVDAAARYPVRIITHGDNRGLSAARNTALLASRTEYLANLDSDVVPDTHWLERLMLRFESERLNREAGEATGQPLGGVMGRLDELHDVSLPDQWRGIHMGQHHGDEPLDEVPHIYGCNGVYLRQALFQAGGHDERYRTNGEDCDASERVRKLGYRLAYEPAARCRHLRRDTLESVLRTIWRYHTPYYEYRYGLFATGDPQDLLKKLPENLSRHQDDLRLDQERRSFHLAYVTFLGLPWRILSDFKLAASHCPPDRAAALRQTQAAVFLGQFTLLGELDCRDDLLAMVQEDLAACLPDDAALAALCGMEQVQQLLRVVRGEPGLNPVQSLTERDPGAVAACLRAMGEVWSNFDELHWSMIRASAHRLRHEREYRGALADGALKVAVVNPPWNVDGRIGVRAGSRWPFTQDAGGNRVPAYVPFPFFLATATAMLKRDGFEVTMVDAIAEGLYVEEFCRRLEGFDPDVVVMETATASHEIDLDWALQLKERLGDQVRVVLCGPHATALGADLLIEAPQVDAILLGEYEPSCLDLVRALRSGGTWDDIPGLIWRDADGLVHQQTERRQLPPMSEFPWPERETLPIYNYFDSFANAMPWPNVQMHASRGCPFKCIFCVWPQVVYDGQNYRVRDNDDIAAEMAWLVDRFGFRAVYFDDDTFNIDNERIIDLCEKIEAQGLKVPMCAMGRADTSSREALEAMKRAGLVGIKFGVETGDAEMMKRIRKHLDLGKVRQAVAWCKELGIGTHLTFSFGGPGETRETAEKTINLALELDPDTVQFSLMTPFPGTSMFTDAVAKGTLLTTDWKQFDGARYTVVRGEHLTREELEGVLLEAHQRWLLHLTERAVRQAGDLSLDGRVRVTADQVDALPERAAEVLQLITPLERAADPAHLLSRCYVKLRPGGVLLALRSGPDHLPPGWCDQPIAEWAAYNGMEVLCRFEGFNQELSLGLRRTREHDSYDELAAFTGESRADVVAVSSRGEEPVAEAWNAADTATPEGIDRFYREARCFLYEQTQWEVNDLYWRVNLAARPHGRLLDYGCGIGTSSLHAAKAGNRVDAYDLSTAQREYLKWRIPRYHAEIADRLRVLESIAELAEYDSIICLHVLEHVADPRALLRMLVDHLAPDGTIYLIAPFDRVGESHPQHLLEHQHLTLAGLLAEVGMAVVEVEQYNIFDLTIGRRAAVVHQPGERLAAAGD